MAAPLLWKWYCHHWPLFSGRQHRTSSLSGQVCLDSHQPLLKVRKSEMKNHCAPFCSALTDSSGFFERSMVTEILERKILDYREICGQIISNPNVWEISRLYMKMKRIGKLLFCCYSNLTIAESGECVARKRFWWWQLMLIHNWPIATFLYRKTV